MAQWSLSILNFPAVLDDVLVMADLPYDIWICVLSFTRKACLEWHLSTRTRFQLSSCTSTLVFHEVLDTDNTGGFTAADLYLLK